MTAIAQPRPRAGGVKTKQQQQRPPRAAAAPLSLACLLPDPPTTSAPARLPARLPRPRRRGRGRPRYAGPLSPPLAPPPLVNRHAVLVPEAVERALGDTTFAKLMASKRRLPDSHPHSQRVSRLGARLARLAAAGDGGKGYTSHLADCAWRFVVVQDPDINACALPGGKVVINSGLVDRFEGDDDALAFVIAHEIGHVTARHSAEQLTLSAATQVMAVVAQTIVAVAGAAGGAGAALDTRGRETMESLLQMGLFRPRSREQEFEADAIGVDLCARAGFGPPAAGSLRVFQCFDEMARRQGSPSGGVEKLFSFMSTHPTPRDRALAVRERAQLMLAR